MSCFSVPKALIFHPCSLSSFFTVGVTMTPSLGTNVEPLEATPLLLDCVALAKDDTIEQICALVPLC